MGVQIGDSFVRTADFHVPTKVNRVMNGRPSDSPAQSRIRVRVSGLFDSCRQCRSYEEDYYSGKGFQADRAAGLFESPIDR